jgi:hypothetical protein
MKAPQIFGCVIAIGFACGCVGVRQEGVRSDERAASFPAPLPADTVPTPSATPFDQDPALRAAYLDGYRLGYRYAAVGTGMSNCGWSKTPAFRAGQRGIDDRQRDGGAKFKLTLRLDTTPNSELESAKKYLEEALDKADAEGGKDKKPNQT